MSRTKELFGELDAPEATVEELSSRAVAAEYRLKQEREWAANHPREWAEWIRISSLLMPTYDFGSGEWYDFAQFRQEVGKRPSDGHFIRRKDNALPYQAGNLIWRRRRLKATGDYLTYQQVAEVFGIKKSALYRLKDQNLVEWSKPPGSSYLFSRASLQQLMKDSGRSPRARATASQPVSTPRRARKTSPPSGCGFRFLK